QYLTPASGRNGDSTMALCYDTAKGEQYAEELMCVASDHALRLRTDYFAIESYDGEVANVYGLGYDGFEWYVVFTTPNETYAGDIRPLYTEDMVVAVTVFNDSLLDTVG